MKVKDILEIIFKYVIGTPIYVVGILAIALVALSRVPEYSFITKYIVTLALTH